MKKIFHTTLLLTVMLLTSCAPANLQTDGPTQISMTATQTPPAPATATMTMTLTPVPTASMVPTSVPLFFIEEFNADMGAWVSFQTGGAQAPVINLENDSLRIDFSSPDTWYYAIHNAHEYSNVYVSAKFVGTSSGSIGVFCDYSEANGWYEFNLSSNGTYNVLFGQLLTQGIAQYTPIATDGSEYLQPRSLNYEIGMTCQENILLLHINGKLFRKLDVTRFGLTEGKIGVTASSFEATPLTVVFDWVKVSEPE